MFKLLEPKKGLYFAYLLFLLSLNVLCVTSDDDAKFIKHINKPFSLKNNKIVANSIENGGLSDNSANSNLITNSPIKANNKGLLFKGNKNSKLHFYITFFSN